MGVARGFLEFLVLFAIVLAYVHSAVTVAGWLAEAGAPRILGVVAMAGVALAFAYAYVWVVEWMARRRGA